ncbi:MAG: hypothetical protein WAV67_14515 [Dokdonella sp.]
MQWQFPPTRRTGSPIAQVVAGVIGIVVIVTLGLFALGAAAIIVVSLVIGFAVRRLLSGQSPNPPQPFQPGTRIETPTHGNVIDGEYVVVEPDHVNTGHAESDRGGPYRRS